MGTQSELLAVLQAVDAEFEPALSARLSLADYAAKLADKAAVFSLCEEGRMRAFAAFYCNDPARALAYLSMIAVLPAERGAGLAANLLGSGIAHLRRRGFALLRLEVYASNTAAIALYTKLGFRQAGTAGASLFMELPLAPAVAAAGGAASCP